MKTLFLGLCLAIAAPALAGAPTDVVLTQVASGLSGPTAIVSPHDGSGRMFVVENQSGQGRLRIIDAAGNLLATPYYSHAITGGSGSEQGMLGLAFDPDFSSNGRLYVTYTAPGSDPKLGAQPDQVLIRLTASNPAANVFAGTEQVVLRIPDIYWNHNGGNIAFGPDGYLYWGMGDGGSGGDPNDFSQNLWKKTVSGKSYYLLGKMMRLDVDTPTASAAANQCGATAGQPAEYSIPAGNPYAGASDKCGEIWLYGLRNPWRWSFDRQTGDLVIGDVGQNQYEEIDFRPAGTPLAGNDYGWKLCEGNHYYSPSGPGTDCPASTGTLAPVIEYSHSGSGGCSVTGGYIYRGPVTSLRDSYVFSDYCAGKIWIADVDAGMPTWNYATLAGTPSMNVYSFGESEIGDLYVVDGGGKIYRFDSTTVPVFHVVTPVAGPGGALVPGVPQTVEDGDTVSFSVDADPGHAIASVSGCGGSLVGTTYTTAPVTADCTVSATFAATTHTVTPMAGAGGTLTPGTPQTVDDGDTVAFTLIPDQGHVIQSASGCGGSLAGSLYTTGPIHADCIVAAIFGTDPDIIFQSGFEM